MRPTSVEMRKPMPTVGVPKNSATMAPIRAKVELILSALNTNGSAAGRRSLQQGGEPGSAVGAHQIELEPARGSEARHRVHQHREEGHHHHHGGLGRPVEAEPHHHDGRDAHDRQGGGEVAQRQESAAQERDGVGQDRHQKSGSAAHGPADQHGVQEGLDEVGPQDRDRGGEGGADRRRARHQHGRHAEADGGDLPEEQDAGAEGHGHGEIEQSATDRIQQLDPRQAIDREPSGEPQAQTCSQKPGPAAPATPGR